VLRLLIKEEQEMSRIGKLPINLPSGVSVTVNGETVTVKGPKGELRQQINPEIQVSVEDGVVTFTRPSDEKQHRSMHGLYRALINNMVVGVSQGFVKKLELVGVGYRAASNGQVIELSLGYSHPIHLMVPPEIKVEAVTDRKSNPIITLESVDKQLLGHGLRQDSFVA
jgi:large subunit ribosomal protein L6